MCAPRAPSPWRAPVRRVCPSPRALSALRSALQTVPTVSPSLHISPLASGASRGGAGRPPRERQATAPLCASRLAARPARGSAARRPGPGQPQLGELVTMSWSWSCPLPLPPCVPVCARSLCPALSLLCAPVCGPLCLCGGVCVCVCYLLLQLDIDTDTDTHAFTPPESTSTHVCHTLTRHISTTRTRACIHSSTAAVAALCALSSHSRSSHGGGAKGPGILYSLSSFGHQSRLDVLCEVCTHAPLCKLYELWPWPWPLVSCVVQRPCPLFAVPATEPAALITLPALHSERPIARMSRAYMRPT